jgi:hypothetical protein
MNSSRATAAVLLLGAIAALGSSPSAAGTVGLTWDPSAGAAGYRVYYGPQGGAYDPTPLWSGFGTEAEVDVPDCAAWEFVVTAYNAAGESGYSNPVVTWPRPEVGQITPSVAETLQGGVLTMSVLGSNFHDGGWVEFDPAPCLVGECIIVDQRSIEDLGSCEFLWTFRVTVEPTASGNQPAEARTYALKVVNPSGVADSSASALQVRVNPVRFNVATGSANDITQTRLDGDDLGVYAPSHASCLREAECCQEDVLGRQWCEENTYSRYDPDHDFDGNGQNDGDDLYLWTPVWGTCWQDGQWGAACPE